MSCFPIGLSVLEPCELFFWPFLFSLLRPILGESRRLIWSMLAGDASSSSTFLLFDLAVDWHCFVLVPPVGATCILVEELFFSRNVPSDNLPVPGKVIIVRELPDYETRVFYNPLGLLVEVEKLIHISKKTVYPTLELLEKISILLTLRRQDK